MVNTLKKFIGILAVPFMITACTSAEAESVNVNVDDDLDYCAAQVSRSLKVLHSADSTDYTMMPRNITGEDTTWHCRKATPDEWCAGFWPGILWYNYEMTRDELVREEAERYTASLEFLSQRPAFDHDLGFLVFCSYGNGYRLTGNPKFKQVILDLSLIHI